ncbi:Uncharacterized membrane-anchored protein [Andreprevotia lacus DSM 23236]|jgi:uncharacterized membrane-anchored protein|uniref:Uncharacterized membrane-anchored protein n=1 Tax=Andreprevotia lacus DSM 23236 TaxID=1121001 RepID=A0A1W1XGQ3_9NEIS|nr:GDYXXLXY domain-containing protein [Andreprevotia lacus]SMC23163.1 Uncharacterized membrane-anchored protein [Andreprevotia lacus DSM 23236]
MQPRLIAFAATAALTLLVLNGLVERHERTLAHGRDLLLALRPVDPRSLMQGDYMALDYQAIRQIEDTLRQPGINPRLSPDDGDVLRAFFKPDPQGVAQLTRVGNGAVDARPDEIMVRIKWVGGSPRLPSNDYFFAEGEGRRFAQAKYALFRVADDGTALLAGLADAQRVLIADHVAPAQRGP